MKTQKQCKGIWFFPSTAYMHKKIFILILFAEIFMIEIIIDNIMYVIITGFKRETDLLLRLLQFNTVSRITER